MLSKLGKHKGKTLGEKMVKGMLVRPLTLSHSGASLLTLVKVFGHISECLGLFGCHKETSSHTFVFNRSGVKFGTSPEKCPLYHFRQEKAVDTSKYHATCRLH